MKKLQILALALLLCLPCFAQRVSQAITIDVDKDPVASDSVYIFGGSVAFSFPVRDSAEMTVETVGAEISHGSMPLMDGSSLSDYKLLLYCSENAATTIVTDFSGSSNDFNSSVNTSAIHDTGGVGGYGFSFNGSSEYLLRADDADFDVASGESITIGFWFKTDAKGDWFFDKADDSLGNVDSYLDASGYFAWRIWDGATLDTSLGSTDYSDDEFHLAVLTIEDGATQNSYIDGALDSTNTISGDGWDNAGGLYIGVNHGLSAYLAGEIDGFFIIKGWYPSATQVESHYEKAKAALQAAKVRTIASETATTAEYLGVITLLEPYKGYLRVRSSAAQTSDREILVHFER